MQLDVGSEPYLSTSQALCLLISYYYSVRDGQTDRQTESNAYEPTVQYAQVGSKFSFSIGKVAVLESGFCT